jgi:hypothetical protein
MHAGIFAFLGGGLMVWRIWSWRVWSCRAVMVSVTNTIAIILKVPARKVMPVVSYSYATLFGCTVLLGLYAVAVEKATWTGSHTLSLFGWTAPGLAPYVFVLALLIATFGVIGTNFAFNIINPVIITTLSLSDSVLTGWFSWVTGLEGLPDPWTIAGGVVLLVGIGFVVVFEHRRKQAEQQMQQPPGLDAPASDSSTAVSQVRALAPLDVHAVWSSADAPHDDWFDHDFSLYPDCAVPAHTPTQ